MLEPQEMLRKTTKLGNQNVARLCGPHLAKAKPLSMLPCNSGIILSYQPCSYSEIVPKPWISSAPFVPRVTGEEKNGVDAMEDSTNAHSVMPFSPLRPRRTDTAKRAPAYAIESVAEPRPSFAFTTSSPPN